MTLDMQHDGLLVHVVPHREMKIWKRKEKKEKWTEMKEKWEMRVHLVMGMCWNDALWKVLYTLYIIGVIANVLADHDHALHVTCVVWIVCLSQDIQNGSFLSEFGIGFHIGSNFMKLWPSVHSHGILKRGWHVKTRTKMSLYICTEMNVSLY